MRGRKVCSQERKRGEKRRERSSSESKPQRRNRSCVYLFKTIAPLKEKEISNEHRCSLVCERTFRAGSFFTYRKHRVLPNIQYLLAYKSTSTYYIREIYIYGKREGKKKRIWRIVHRDRHAIFQPLTESRFDEGKKTRLSSYFIFVAKIRSPNSFPQKVLLRIFQFKEYY